MTHTLFALFLFLIPSVVLASGLSSVVLLSILCLYLCLSERIWQYGYLLRGRWVLCALAFSAWLLLTGGWSLLPALTVKTVMRFSLMTIMVLMLVRLLGDHKATVLSGQRYAYGILLVSGVLITEYMPFGGIISWGLHWIERDSTIFFSQDINRGLCALVVLVWPAVFVLGNAGKHKLAFALPLLLLVAVLAMDSLAAQTACLIAIAIFYGMLLFPSMMGKVVPWGVFILLAVWPPLFLYAEGWIRDYLYIHLPASSQHRIEIWRFAMSIWQDAPWLGWGVNASRAVAGADILVRPGWVQMPMHPHNMPLQVLVEQGLVGYAMTVMVILLVLKRIFRFQLLGQRLLLQNASIAGAVAAYFVVAFSAFNMWQSWWMATGLLTILLFRLFLNERQLQ